MSNDCMVPNCSRAVRSRGVCNSCLSGFSRAIKAGRTTWMDLEMAGLVLAKHKGRSASSVAVTSLEAKKGKVS